VSFESYFESLELVFEVGGERRLELETFRGEVGSLCSFRAAMMYSYFLRAIK